MQTVPVLYGNFTWKADDADEPVRMLINGHHNEVLVEEVDLLGPLAHPVVAFLGRTQVGIVLHRVKAWRGGSATGASPFAVGPRCEALVEVGGEDVRALQHGGSVLILPVLQVSVQKKTVNC